MREYVFSSLIMLGVSLIFSLIGIVFLVDTIPSWIRVIVGFIFIAPLFILFYNCGKGSGEKLYRKCSKNSLTDLHSGQGVEIPLHKCIFHVLIYAIPLLIIIVLMFLLKNTILHLIVTLFLSPITVIFTALNVFPAGVIVWQMLITYIPLLLIYCGAFISGYVLKINKLKNQQRDIESELRMFNN